MKHSSFFWLYLSVGLYALVLLVFGLFSFSFTDPNLVLSSNEYYWSFQQWLWRTWFDNPPIQANTYVVLVTLIWASFSFVATQLWQHRALVNWSLRLGILVAIILSTCLISYNALSHDVFNYAFNARMVVLYQENPHIKVALDFQHDDWLRFMHNTHTTAPYGYGWTAVSVVPYVIGGGKFVPTWLLFRGLAMLSLLATGYVLWHWLAFAKSKQRRWVVVALCLSPLVLLEVVVNMHNDLWMVFPAISSIYLLDRWRLGGRHLLLVVSILLLAISIFIKFATLVLIPVVVIAIIARLIKKNTSFSSHDLALAASILLLIPLMTTRSQLFHPWYLTWSLMWLPLIRRNGWIAILIGLSVSSAYRYVPWIAAGGFAGDVLLHQQLVTWVGGTVVALIAWLVLRRAAQSV